MSKRYLLCCVALAAQTGCDDTIYQPQGTYDPNWVGVKALLDDHCEACHGPPIRGIPRFANSTAEVNYGATWPDDLRNDVLDDSYAYFVVPGDAEASLIYQALIGTGTVNVEGTPTPLPIMPLGSTGLLPDQIAVVRDWIDEGASLDTGIDTDGAPQ